MDRGLITDPSLAERNEYGPIIFVRNFRIDTDEEKLYSLFSPFGAVRKVGAGTEQSTCGRVLLVFGGPPARSPTLHNSQPELYTIRASRS